MNDNDKAIEELAEWLYKKIVIPPMWDKDGTAYFNFASAKQRALSLATDPSLQALIEKATGKRLVDPEDLRLISKEIGATSGLCWAHGYRCPQETSEAGERVFGFLKEAQGG